MLELYCDIDRSGATESDRYPEHMDIAISDEALEMVRSKGGTAAVDYIQAIG